MHSECLARRARIVRPAVVIAGVIAVAIAAPFGVGCSAPPSDAPAGHADEREVVAEADVGGAPTARGDITAWPTAGWFRLDLEAQIVLDEATTVSWSATTAGWWDGERFEWWTESPTGPATTERQVAHRVEHGDRAGAAVAARAGMFGAAVEAGLREDGVGDHGGRVFMVSVVEAGSTVAERWEIGAGAPPWGSYGPFPPRS